jgi:hypothetical protein
MSLYGPTLAAALAYLDALDQAGLPPPPPPSLVRAWLRIYIAADRDQLRLRRGWSTVPPHIVSAGFKETDRLRASSDLPHLVDEFLSVVNWALTTHPHLDANQRRAGWRWLAQQAREWETASPSAPGQHDRTWPSPLGEFARGPWIIAPLLSSSSLVRESRLMRNCLREYSEVCADGQVRIFSVRHRRGRRPVADIGIERDNERWLFAECKGFANQPPDRAIMRLGMEIARRYTELDTAINERTNLP